MAKKVDVVIISFQGVIDSVSVFADSLSMSSEDKALAFLCEQIGEDFKDAAAFGKWNDANSEGDNKDEYRWEVCEIE